jgi:uncharacterized protein (DUF4415 family)
MRSPPRADLRRAAPARQLRLRRPATEALPEFIGKKAAEKLVRRSRGRPPKQNKKVNQTLRLGTDVLEAFRQEGSGWQVRINEILRENMPRREK